MKVGGVLRSQRENISIFILSFYNPKLTNDHSSPVVRLLSSWENTVQ